MGGLQSLLVTDIVGSTRLWAEYEAAMELDLVSHDQLVADAIRRAGGRVFKHTGDGAMATFEGASASAAAAVDVQRRIGQQVWRVPGGIRVRVALHSGSVHERDGDLFGPPVNRLARLLSRCPPGAVLVSDATAALLVDGIPDGLRLDELGRVELPDVGRSEVVHCLVGEHLAVVTTQELGPLGTRSGLVPVIDDDLVGRRSELTAVIDAVSTHPVVSIVGVSGMGKTRLALEAAAAVDVRDGAWWCDLTAATSPDEVPATVLASVGARQSAGRTVTECIVDHLADRSALVVLDNCEHVLTAAHALVSALRSRCEGVRVLATSREALRMRGEHIVSLSSLPPSDAIGLFCSRAVEARPDLGFDDATLAVIEEICARLDGIPLAIELAASRCRSMSPVEIASRLDDRFRLLRGGRTGVERHRTLQAAVDWSYSLLDIDERALFDRLAVFAGGALLDAIAAVGGLDEYDALDVLDRLIARSMVVATPTSQGTRYRQLETLRQYGEDRLVERGISEQVRDRHLAWARDLAESLASVAMSSGELDGFRRYLAEIDNFRAAVRYTVTADRPLEACEVIAGIGLNAIYRPTFEVADWIDPILIPAERWTRAVASTAGMSASFAFYAGDIPRMNEVLRSVPTAYEHDYHVVTAATLELLFVENDDARCEAMLEAVVPVDAVATLRLAQNRALVAVGRIHTDRAGDLEYRSAALSRCEQHVAELRAVDAHMSLALALFILGGCLEGLEDLGRSIAVHSEAIALAEQADAGFLIDVSQLGLAIAVSKVGATNPQQLREAAATIRNTIQAAMERSNRFLLQSIVSTVLERVLVAAGDPRSAVLIGTAGRRHFPGTIEDAVVGAETLESEEITAIEAEAAQLDLESTCAIALEALDRVIAANS